MSQESKKGNYPTIGSTDTRYCDNPKHITNKFTHQVYSAQNDGEYRVYGYVCQTLMHRRGMLDGVYNTREVCGKFHALNRVKRKF